MNRIGTALLTLALLFSGALLLRADTPIDISKPSRHFAASYEPVSTVMVAWPVEYPSYWSTYASLVQELSGGVNVIVIVPDEAEEQTVRDYLTKDQEIQLSRLSFWHIPVDTIWIRDYGPLYVTDNDVITQPSILDATYVPLHGFPSHRDDRVPLEVSAVQGRVVEKLDLLIEGGNILSDGLGTCFTSVTILYRNLPIEEHHIREMLRSQLGCEQLIILPILTGEGTGHVDLMIKVVNANTLMVASCENEYDDNCALLDRIAERLRLTRNTQGSVYEIVRVPIVLVNVSNRDRRYVSFVNSLTVNEFVFIPQVGLPEDTVALNIYQETMKEHTIIPVDTSVLAYSGGLIHCITLTIPDETNIPSGYD
jgi:agmatine deiminase